MKKMYRKAFSLIRRKHAAKLETERIDVHPRESWIDKVIKANDQYLKALFGFPVDHNH